MTSPLPTVFSESRFPVTSASTRTMNASLSVLFGQRAADVGGGQDGEDERLKGGYEDLETDEGDRHREREGGEHDEPATLKERDRAVEEDGEQDVAGQEEGSETA